MPRGIFIGANFTPIKIVGISGDGRLDPIETFIDANENGVFDIGETDIGLLSNFSLTQLNENDQVIFTTYFL